MVHITSITQSDVLQKVDVDYVESNFVHIDNDITIVFICTDENYRQEDTWQKKGRTYYAIRLPYEQVKALDDARPLMLELVAKRLGVPVPQINQPVSGIAV